MYKSWQTQCWKSHCTCNFGISHKSDIERNHSHNTYHNALNTYICKYLFCKYRLIFRSRLFIHNITAVRFNTECNRRQTVRKQVYKQQMHRFKRNRQRHKWRIQYRKYTCRIARKQELNCTLNISVQITSVFDCLDYRCKIIVCKHHWRSVFCHFTARYTHCHTYIRLFKCRCVIHSVTGHWNDIAFSLPCADYSYFMFRRNSCINRHVRNKFIKFFIWQIFNFSALYRTAVIIQYTDFSCNRRCSHKVIAGYHYRTYSGGFTFSYRFGTFFSRRVLHCNKSEQDIVLFIFNAYVDCINVTFAHSKYTKSHLRKFRINFL